MKEIAAAPFADVAAAYLHSMPQFGATAPSYRSLAQRYGVSVGYVRAAVAAALGRPPRERERRPPRADRHKLAGEHCAAVLAMLHSRGGQVYLDEIQEMLAALPHNPVHVSLSTISRTLRLRLGMGRDKPRQRRRRCNA